MRPKTSHEIANEVRMKRTQFNGSFFIVEGDSDARFYKNLVNQSHCNRVIASGKETAMAALNILENESVAGVLAVVDADFDLLENNLPTSSNLFLSDHHDLEVMLFLSQALDKVLTELGSAEKIERFEQRIQKEVRSVLFSEAKKVGYLRWLSLQQHLNLKFEGLSYRNFLQEPTLEIELPGLIRTVKNNSQQHSLNEQEIQHQLLSLLAENHDPHLVCCGHDLTGILSVALRKTLGTNDTGKVEPEIIERSLRLAFESSHFATTQLFQSIRQWEQNNPPFKVLRDSL